MTEIFLFLDLNQIFMSRETTFVFYKMTENTFPGILLQTESYHRTKL